MGIFSGLGSVIPGGDFFDPQTASKSTLTNAQEELLKALGPLLEDLLGSIPGNLTQQFPTFDEEVPGLTDLQKSAIQGGGEGITDPLLLGGRDTILDILARADPGSPEFDEFFRTNIENPLRETAFGGSDSIISELNRRGAAGGTTFGSQSGQREGALGEDLLDTLGRERSNLSNLFTSQALGALGLSEPFTERANIQGLLSLFGLGEAERGVGVQQRQGRLDEFLRQLNERNTRIGLAGNVALSPTQSVIGGPSTGGSIGSATSGSASGAGSILGGLCWVAAVYFGWYTPAWFAARNWLMRDWKSPIAPLFRKLYIEHGESIAADISKDRVMRNRYKPFFEWARYMGEA